MDILENNKTKGIFILNKTQEKNPETIKWTAVFG